MAAGIKFDADGADVSMATVCKGRRASMALHQSPYVRRGGVDNSRRDAAVRLLPDAGTGRAAVRSDRADAHLGVADTERRFRTLIEQAADGIFVTDADGRIVLANSRMCFLLGYSQDEILGLDVLATYLPEDREIGGQFLSRLAPGTTFRFERMLMRKDGTAFPIEASVAWLPGGERQTIVRDMTARRRADEAIRLEERRLRAIVRLSELVPPSLEGFLDAAVVELRSLVNSAFAYIALCSDTCETLTVQAWSQEGVTVGPRRGRTFSVADSGWLGEAVRECRPIVMNEVSVSAPDGADEPADTSPTPADLLRGPMAVDVLLGPMAVERDSVRMPGTEVGALVALDAGADDALHPPLMRFLSVPIRDRGRIVGVAGAGNKPTRYTDQDVRQVTQMMDVVWKMAERQRAEDGLRGLNEDLELRVVQRTAEYEAANAELEAANEQLASANAQLQSLLTEQENLHAELAHQALHDPLTGLGNRLLFAERLDYAFAKSRRGVAVLWIDLDHFKQINDIFGHEVGDEVLIAVADKLREVVRETDDIARMGGDEFAVVLPNVFEPDAQLVAGRVLEALTDPEAFRLHVGASIGVAWQAPGGKDRKSLVRQADLAMYRAKESGGSKVVG